MSDSNEFNHAVAKARNDNHLSYERRKVAIDNVRLLAELAVIDYNTAIDLLEREDIATVKLSSLNLLEA